MFLNISCQRLEDQIDLLLDKIHSEVEQSFVEFLLVTCFYAIPGVVCLLKIMTLILVFTNVEIS